MKLISFGYKNRLPPKADRVFDCRNLPNPHDVPELRGKPGTLKAVQDYVLQPGPELDAIMRCAWSGATEDATLAFGCAGGTGRSVAVVLAVARRLQMSGEAVEIVHMELPK